jgi:hypothetical protein
VNLERKRLELPDSKTGAKLVFVNEPVIELLSGLPRLRQIRSLSRAPKPVSTWSTCRSVAPHPQGSDVRIHDLRHNYASVAAGLGEVYR